MKINQAFETLRAAGGIRAARIITEKNPKISRLSVWIAAKKLRRGVPVAKITGRRWFFGIEFHTNRHTLDPRPDTETLVSAVLADHGANGSVRATANTPAGPRILDLGTGTGCIIISVCANLAGAHGVAIDISRGARRVARKNVRENGLAERISVRRGNFMRTMNIDGRFDVIVSNPPYIARDDARVDAGAMHDPAVALYARDAGYATYTAIAKNAKKLIEKDGKMYLEIGADMGDRVRDIFTSAGWRFVRAVCDLGGVERVLIFAAPADGATA